MSSPIVGPNDPPTEYDGSLQLTDGMWPRKRSAGKVVRLLTESVRSQGTAAQAVRHMKGADQKTDSPTPPGSVVDLFCGAGGLAHGLLREGFHIAAGVDVDPRCRYPFEHNNAARFILRDVDELQASEIVELFEVNQPQNSGRLCSLPGVFRSTIRRIVIRVGN